MRTTARAAAVALGAVLLLDVLRVWLPSIITIFGQAASTPPERLAGFGLAWFVAGFAAPAVARPAGPGRLALAGGVLLAAARLALPLTGGGRAQLYVACVGVVAGLAWLAGTAMAGGSPLAALAGLGAAAVLHAGLATVDLTWRTGPPAWALLGAEAAAFVGCLAVGAGADGRRRSPGAPPLGAPAPGAPARGWFLVGPAALLAGMWAASPALAGAAVSDWSGRLAGLGAAATPGPAGAAAAALLTAACAVALVGAGVLTSGVPGAGVPGAGVPDAGVPGPGAPGSGVPGAGSGAQARWLVPAAGALLVAGAAAFGLGWTAALPAAMVAGAAALGACVGAASAAPTTSDSSGPAGPGDTTATGRAGYAAVGGMVVFAGGAVAYYAAYDVGYPNWWVPPALAAVIALVAAGRDRSGAFARTPATTRTGAAPGRPAVAACVAAAVLLPAAGAWWTPPAAPEQPGPEQPGPEQAAGGRSGAEGIRVVAYNIRMGFGLSGRYAPDRLAAVIARQRPDVVVLGEVDRAWLLNGGHDTLDALARRLDMRYWFGPAADQVWGDAVLTRLPVRDAGSVRLPDDGAPTGAQALGLRIATPHGEIAVVATHLQPPPGRPPLAQARALIRFADAFRRGGPGVIAGDLNVEPGGEVFGLLTGAGYADALAAARPLPTSPADDPRNEIDHVLATPDLAGFAAAAPRTTDSDHLPVAVTLRPAG